MVNDEQRFDELHRALAANELFEPLELGGADEALWVDCELASLAENRLGEASDPRGLSEERRTSWRARATTEDTRPPSQREYDRAYWLLDRGARIGTVSVSTSGMGSARLASLYVFPDVRGRGHGRRALERIREMLHGVKLGLRLETCWTWQRSVRFYLCEGLWVKTWKRDLDFWSYPDEPKPILDIGESKATLSVRLASGERLVLEEATRNADEVVFANNDALLAEREKIIGEAAWNAMTTLSVALALAGWPLVRSRRQWDIDRDSDFGAPEGLAHKITLWEAWEKKQGWRVETPRIAGLEYPTWAELTF